MLIEVNSCIMSKKTAVVLINWNSFEYTSQCIESLMNCDQTQFDIIVVDNGSEDGSGKKLKDNFPQINLVQSDSNIGFAGGNNLGMAQAIDSKYTYIMMLNNDTFVEPNLIDVLANYMDHNPEVGIIQPKIFFNHDRTLLWNGGSYFNPIISLAHTKGYFKKDSKEYNSIKEVDWVTGCAFFTRSDILKKSGGFNEKFFIYFEDVDLSFRIKKLGYKLIYHPGGIVYHIEGMSNKSKTKDKEGYQKPIVHYLNQRNRIWFIKKYVKPLFVLPTLMYHGSYSLALVLYFIIRRRFKKLNALLLGIKDGFKDSI